MFSTQKLARRSAERPKLTISVWIAILVASAVTIATLLSGVLSPSFTFVNSPEAVRADDQMTALGQTEAVHEQVMLTAPSGSTFKDPKLLSFADVLAKRITDLGPDYVTRVVPPSASPALISQDGTTALIAVEMAGDLTDANDEISHVTEITKAANGTQGVDIKMAGLSSMNEEVNHIAEEDLVTGESIGIGIGLIILLLVFGAVVAAFVPIIMAITSILVALALTALVGQIGELSFFVQNMVTMMGLALGIDYTLFILSRYREERAAGVAKLDAIERAGATSGRAVFFSGLTVIVALLGLMIVPMSVFLSLAIGAILVAFAAVLAGLTLLPAILSLLGDRVNRGRLGRLASRTPDQMEGGFWARIVHTVMRRPALWFAGTTLVLLLAATPYLGINTGASGVTSLPPTSDARQAFETLQQKFSVGDISPVRIPVMGDPDSADNQAQIAAIREAAAKDPVLGEPTFAPSDGDRGGVLTVPLLTASTSAEAETAVRDLREVTDLNVGGSTAFNVDYFDISSRYLPYVVAIVLFFSFVILLLAFRSIVVPVVAILLNLLSVGAAFGLLTLVSQEGVGADLLGFQQVDTVEAWIPIFLFAVLFGLSMDYHVFLLSRMREHFQRTGDARGAISYGISSSGRLITGAALIMVAVFSGFATGRLVMFQQMGFGLGVAILLDATLVRGILVPSIMQLLGERNWYLPKWLNWLPNVSIEGEASPTPADPVPAGVAAATSGEGRSTES